MLVFPHPGSPVKKVTFDFPFKIVFSKSATNIIRD